MKVVAKYHRFDSYSAGRIHMVGNPTKVGLIETTIVTAKSDNFNDVYIKFQNRFLKSYNSGLFEPL